MNKGKVFLIGMSLVITSAMTRQEYNDYRGWKLPSDENGDDRGYLVENLPLPSNFPGSDGFISFLPEKEFKTIYCENGQLGFARALDTLLSGACSSISRSGWNGKNLKVIADKIRDDNDHWHKVFMIVYPDDSKNIWVPSPTDLVAFDWSIEVELTA